MAKRPSPWRKQVRVKGRRVVVDPDLPALSETMLSFAKPLLDNLPGDPPSIDQVRQAMHFATILWNLDAVADGEQAFSDDVRAALGVVPEDLGPNAAAILETMLQARRTRYRYDRRVISVEVVEADGGWNIVAQGALPD